MAHLPRRLSLLAAAGLCTLALLVLAGCGGTASSSSNPRSQPSQPGHPTSSGATVGYEGMPLQTGPELAPAASTTHGREVDGIRCGATEQLAYHIHAHLAVYARGVAQSLSPGIGIPGALVQQSQFGPVVGQGQCFYWLHTHTPDGVLHIESPTSRIYTLGNFFDEWRQPLSADRVGPDAGKVTAFVNGKPWTKNPRTIPLERHSVIQLDVGLPITPYQPVSFANTQL